MPTGEGKSARKRATAEPGNGSQDAVKNRKVTIKPFADHAEALAYLKARLNVETLRPSSVDVGKVFQTGRMAALMERLGNPHQSFRSVHVAGSKGKGSVCEMTASCLEACGYTVGLFTSPHLVDVSERIRINQSRIGPGEFAACLSRVAQAGADLPKAAGEATYFEMLTAAAFVHFAEMAVDIAVVEVGLGGTGDATNVLTPRVSAITAIQMEHASLLGGTLASIARAKAGIMKAGVPCVTVPQEEAVLGVFREVAREVGTTVEVLGVEIDFSYRFESSPDLGPHTRVVVSSPKSNFEHLPVPLRGEHQAVNCGLALAILDKLREPKFDTPELMVAQGLARTPNHGRMELVHAHPRVFVDGAHNPESVHALVRSLAAHVRHESMVVVFGCAADKDIGAMLSSLAHGADKVFFTRASDHARAADPRDLQRKFAEVSGKITQSAPTVRDALNLAARAVGRDDIIVVTGSFAVAGEAKRLLQERAAPPRAPAEATIREVKPSALDARADGLARAPRRKG